MSDERGEGHALHRLADVHDPGMRTSSAGDDDLGAQAAGSRRGRRRRRSPHPYRCWSRRRRRAAGHPSAARLPARAGLSCGPCCRNCGHRTSRTARSEFCPPATRTPPAVRVALTGGPGTGCLTPYLIIFYCSKTNSGQVGRRRVCERAADLVLPHRARWCRAGSLRPRRRNGDRRGPSRRSPGAGGAMR